MASRNKYVSVFLIVVSLNLSCHGNSIQMTKKNVTLTPTTTTIRPPKLNQGDIVVKFVELLEFDEDNQQAQFILEIITTTELENALVIQNARKIPEILNTKSLMDTTIKKVKVKIGCEMHYTLYPFESHLCTMTFGISPSQNSSDGEIFPVFCSEDKLKDVQFKVKGYLDMSLKTALLLKGQTQGQVEGQRGKIVYMIMERISAMQIFSQMYSPIIMLTIFSFFTMLDTIPFGMRIGSSLAMFLSLLVLTSLFWRDIPEGRGGETTVLEHYFAIGVGFMFQVVFTNILMYWYSRLAKQYMGLDTSLSMTKRGSVELHPITNNTNGSALKLTETPAIHTKEGLTSEEQFIKEKLGGCHRFMYFKVLKPAKKQLPFAFFLINFIYWPLVICLGMGLPKGFKNVPTSSTTTDILLQCF